MYFLLSYKKGWIRYTWWGTICRIGRDRSGENIKVQFVRFSRRTLWKNYGVVDLKRIWLFILFLFILFECNGIAAFAIDTGFSTEELTTHDIEEFCTNVELSLLLEEPEKKAIDCFDVNEKEMIAIGSDNSERDTIYIYSKCGEFQYGYTFSSSGKFGIEWDNDNLLIYFVRSDIVISVNSMGEIEDVLKIQDTLENNSYWNNSVFGSKKSVGSTEYKIQNDIGLLNAFSDSYSQLVATDDAGNVTVVYDVSKSYISSILLSIAAVIVFVCLVVCTIAKQFATR